MNRTITIIVAVVVILALGYYWYTQRGGNNAPQTENVSSSAQTSPAQTETPSAATGTGSVTSKTVTVRYTRDGFFPATVTINKGDTIMFVDETGGGVWIASNPHPGHEGYDGTTRSEHCASGYTGPAPLDQCSAGTSYSFTFEKTGTWGYHNHRNYTETGTIAVR